MGVGMQYSAAALRAIEVEIRVLSQLCHPHIIAFKGACLAPPTSASWKSWPRGLSLGPAPQPQQPQGSACSPRAPGSNPWAAVQRRPRQQQQQLPAGLQGSSSVALGPGVNCLTP